MWKLNFKNSKESLFLHILCYLHSISLCHKQLVFVNNSCVNTQKVIENKLLVSRKLLLIWSAPFCIAHNVPAYCRSCGFQHTSQRANGGKSSNYFQTTVMPQLWQYARWLSVLAIYFFCLRGFILSQIAKKIFHFRYSCLRMPRH